MICDKILFPSDTILCPSFFIFFHCRCSHQHHTAAGSPIDPANFEIISRIEGVIAILTGRANPVEKRQLVMVSQSVKVLHDQISLNQVSPEVMQKLNYLFNEMANRNFTAAQNIQMDLANTVWNQHKDWLKGIKILFPLAQKY